MFEEKVTKFDLSFTSVLISLLDKISQVILVKMYFLVEYPAEIKPRQIMVSTNVLCSFSWQEKTITRKF